MRTILAAMVAVLIVIAASWQPLAAAEGGPVTVENCGQRLTFDEAPQRAITNDVNMAEFMFALGLEDHMLGRLTYGGANDEYTHGEDTGPWKDSFERVPHLGTEFGKEALIGAQPDFVFAGWNYGFQRDSDITPASLAEVGIPSYVLTETCGGEGGPRGDREVMDGVIHDLRNLGAIFRVPERAEAVIAQFEADLDQARETGPQDDPVRVFLYDSGGDEGPLSSGAHGGPQGIIEAAGGENIFGDLADSWTTVNWETVIARDPEVIAIVDYTYEGNTGPQTVEEKIAYLKAKPELADVTAVRENRFFVLTYADWVASPRNAQAALTLARELTTLRR
ncbi:MAG: ABC transporter substrate-binding protein [Egibacteraceae bacterium]